MRCAVLNCRNQKSKEITMHSFPTDKRTRDKWMRFCGRDGINPKRLVICSAHFAPEDCENDVKYRMGFCSRRVLVPGAIPTLRPEEPPHPREARMHTKNHKRLIADLLKKSTQKDLTSMIENEQAKIDANNSTDKFSLADELPNNEVELKEDPFKDTDATEKYLRQIELSHEDDEESVICEREEQNVLSDIDEDEPLIEISNVYNTSNEGAVKNIVYNPKIKFNVNFPLVTRTIILPISTRSVGFIIRHIVSILWRLQLKDVELYRLTNALYRITLLQFDMKISTAMQSNFIRNSGGRAFINISLPEPVRQMLDELRDNLAPVASYLSAIGFIRTPAASYLPRYPRTKENYPCDPVNVRFSLLRILVMRLTSTKTATEIRRKFFELNPIPGAIWDECASNDKESAIPLLKNADDIMPAGYGLNHLRADCHLIRNSIEKINKKYPKFVCTGGIDWRAKGSMAQLVSSSVIPMRCPTYNGDSLTSIVGEYDHFWSTQHLSKEDFCLGVFCLVGETGSFQHQACFTPRMLESSCQEGDLNYSTVIQSVSKQLF